MRSDRLCSLDDETPRQSETSGSDTETRTIEEEVPTIRSGNEPKHSPPPKPSTSTTVRTQGERDEESHSASVAGSRGLNISTQSHKSDLSSSASSNPRSLSDTRGRTIPSVVTPCPLSHALGHKEAEELKISFDSTPRAQVPVSRKGRQHDALSQSSKSGLSSSQGSHHSPSEGRGFALSPIQLGSLTASGSFLSTRDMKQVQTPVGYGGDQSSSPSPKELVSLADLKTSPARTGGSSGLDTSRQVGKPCSEETGENTSNTRDFPHIPAVESKTLASNSSKDLRVETELRPADKPQGVGISLPLPHRGDTEKSPPQDSGGYSPPDKAHIEDAEAEKTVKKEPSSKYTAPSSIEIHVPATKQHLSTRVEEDTVYTKWSAVEPVSTDDQEVKERYPMASEEEMQLREAGRGLRRELGELQFALEAAGLPGLGENLSDSSDDFGEGGTVTPVSASRDQPVLQQHQSQNKGHLRETTRGESSSSTNIPATSLTLLDSVGLRRGLVSKPSSVGGREGEILSLEDRGTSGKSGLEGTIRALAAEELTSITKELLLLQETGGRQAGHGTEPRREQAVAERESRGREMSELKTLTSGQKTNGMKEHVSRDEEKVDKGGKPVDTLGKSVVSEARLRGRGEDCPQVKGPSLPARPPANSQSNRIERGSSKTGLVGSKTGLVTHKTGLDSRKASLSGSRTSLASTTLSHPNVRVSSDARLLPGGGGDRGGRRGRAGVREGGGGRGRGRGGVREGRGGRGGRGTEERGGRSQLETLQNEVDTWKQALAKEKVKSQILYCVRQAGTVWCVCVCVCVFGSLQARVQSLQCELEENEQRHREEEMTLQNSHRQREKELAEEVSVLSQKVCYL